MKIATVSNNSLSKKQLTYIGIGSVALLTIVGMVLGFFTLQKATRASEEAPQNVSIVPDAKKARVTWETQADTIAVVEYGTEADSSTFSKFAFSENPTKTHSVSMDSLKPDTTYYFQIRVGDTLYDNGGSPWSFKTPKGEEDATPSPELSESPIPTIEGPTETPSVVPTPQISSVTEATPSATISPEASPSAAISTYFLPTMPSAVSIVPTSTGSKCTATDCTTIQKNLGISCTTQDYIRCIYGVSPSSATSITPTSTPVPAAVKSACKVDQFQSNTCKSFSWISTADKGLTCSNVYTKYFVQCKSSSFTSSSSGTWYCNERQDGNTLTVPCGVAPSPAPGQSVFCRVRAETEEGGDTNATEWTYDSMACPNTSNSQTECAISFLQANTCRSWLWDHVNNLDPACAKSFNRYFLQCTSNGDFSGATGTWFCNTTNESHYLDFPCYNAPTPMDSESITCRVRSEDEYGGEYHSTDWIETAVTCPSSTPTPTFTPTPTDTPTPTPTP